MVRQPGDRPKGIPPENDDDDDGFHDDDFFGPVFYREG